MKKENRGDLFIGQPGGFLTADIMTKLIAKNLRKVYKEREVVKNVSLEVSSGQIVGLLGANGAGKTTSFYMIVGIIANNGGQVFIDDSEITDLPMHQRARYGLGYLPQDASVFRKLTVEENLLGVLELNTKLTKKQRMDKVNKILDEYIIVQIQGNQYRHAVEYFDDTIGSRIKRIKKMTKGKEEDDFIPSQQGLDYLTHNYSYLFDFAEASTPQNYPFTAKKGFGQNRVPGYCKYCNGRIGKNGKISCFVYQWVEIPHDMTCNKLVSSVIKDINKIKAIIKRRNP